MSLGNVLLERYSTDVLVLLFVCYIRWCPFVTERLFQRLTSIVEGDNNVPNPISNCIASFPPPNDTRNFHRAEPSMDAFLTNVQAIRALHVEYGLKNSSPSVDIIVTDSPATGCILPHISEILTPCGPVIMCVSGDKSYPPPSGVAIKVVGNLYEMHVVVAGLVDLEAAIEKLQAS